MQSPFRFNDTTPISLERFPKAQVNRSLQAWDAADEYLIHHLSEHMPLTSTDKVWLFNDSFGALALACQPAQVWSVSDSYIAHQGLAANIKANNFDAITITTLTSLDNLPETADVVLYKIPKSKALLIEQLITIRQHISDQTVFIAACRAKDLHSSTLKLFETYLGPTTTSLAVKKARLVFCQPNLAKTSTVPDAKTWPLEQSQFTVTNLANVFSREQLDIGARYFLQYLPKIKPQAKVIDLGCGNGVIGLSVLANQPNCQLTFVDESYMAIASAKANISNNLPDQLEQCVFTVNDCLSGFEEHSADLILCNPPFHQQHAVTDHIAWQMFKQSHRVLKKGGELRIIGNRQLGYHIKLKRLFSRCQLIDSNKKFVIISAIK